MNDQRIKELEAAVRAGKIAVAAAAVGVVANLVAFTAIMGRILGFWS